MLSLIHIFAVFKDPDEGCLLVALPEILKGLPESRVPECVGVFEKAEKGGGPEGRPEKGAVAGLWKADLHLHMAFPEIGQKIDLPVGATADQLSLIHI